ncbi:MAG: thioesterase family protein [Pseudomonadota bacterium]
MQSGLGAIDFETAFYERIEPVEVDYDELGHINNAVYVVWAQKLATSHWRHVANPELQRAYIFVVLRHEAEYRRPLEPGMAIEGRTWLGRASGPRFERFVDIRELGAIRGSALIRTDWCLVDQATRKPKRVPQSILDCFNVTGAG